MKKTTTLLLMIGIFASSCNMPNPNAESEQVSTAAALTVQAVISASSLTPLATPTIAVSATPTFSEPMASVGDVVNCRTGPGANYKRVGEVLPEEPVKIIGVYPYPPNYWVVASSAGDCWISGEFTTPNGSIAAVPTVTAPPAVSASVPEAPTDHKWDYFCNGAGSADVTLTWKDNAKKETGYRVYRDDELVAELPPNSSKYTETIALLSGESVRYRIEAFNTAGATSGEAFTLYC